MSKIHLGLYFIAVMVAAFSQILLKVSANRKYLHKLSIIINPLVISAYCIFVVSMIMTTIALREIPYKMGGMIESSSYILILVFSKIILKEKIGLKRIWGSLIIIIGIFVFNI